MYERLVDLSEQTQALDLPIRRNDPRGAERLFVYRMQSINRTISRKAKAEAIYELMAMDGFRHQYDLRTVERLCKQFAGRKRPKFEQNLPG